MRKKACNSTVKDGARASARVIAENKQARASNLSLHPGSLHNFTSSYRLSLVAASSLCRATRWLGSIATLRGWLLPTLIAAWHKKQWLTLIAAS
jgi:hypothetical protein